MKIIDVILRNFSIKTVANICPVCSSVYRKRIKGPGLPTWLPPSPGDWPVLQILMRRKTGEQLLCVAGKRPPCAVSFISLHCAAMELIDSYLEKRQIS